MVSVRVEGERVVAATREEVFAALTDPEVVAETIPFVERCDVRDGDHWALVVKPPLPLARSLRLAFEVVEKRPPAFARLHAAGGGLAGGAEVDSSFELEQRQGGTLVRFRADLSFRGALAPAERLLEPVAQRQAERTLDAIERRVGG